MQFQQFEPSAHLKPYVAALYLFHSENDDTFCDVVFPSGCMEMIFNLGSGTWESRRGDDFEKTPPTELWGQVTAPLPIRSKGRHTMLGVRLHSHAAAYFLKDNVDEFNDDIFDLRDVVGREVDVLHHQLLESSEDTKRIKLIESFLLARLRRTDRKVSSEKLGEMVSQVRCASSDERLARIATSYGITQRYLHKLIHQHTGLSPKSINKINRFQSSLKLIAKKNLSLTSIALDCGYFDQSHFIRDFKTFTGLTPSAYLHNKFPVNQAVGK